MNQIGPKTYFKNVQCINNYINVTCDFEKLEPDAIKHNCVEFLLNLSITELNSVYVFRCFICFSAW